MANSQTITVCNIRVSLGARPSHTEGGLGLASEGLVPRLH